MGAYLSEPNLEKVSEDGDSGKLSFGASSMQGWRLAQEVNPRHKKPAKIFVIEQCPTSVRLYLYLRR